MLPVSDWFLRCAVAVFVRSTCSEARGVGKASGAVAVASLGVPATLCAGLSQGLGDDRASIGADTGVGRVEVVMVDVAAERGVVRAAESGVYGVLALGESSILAGRSVGSTGVLPARRRLSDNCRVRRGTVVEADGITSGARLFGERG